MSAPLEPGDAAIEQEVLAEAVGAMGDWAGRLPDSSEYRFAFLESRRRIAHAAGIPHLSFAQPSTTWPEDAVAEAIREHGELTDEHWAYLSSRLGCSVDYLMGLADTEAERESGARQSAPPSLSVVSSVDGEGAA